MKKYLALLVCCLLVTFLFVPAVNAVDVYWKNTWINGDWDSGQGSGEFGNPNSPWYYAQFSPNNARGRPDYFGNHIIHFDNDNQTSMTLNGGSWYNINFLLFDSSATVGRTFGGSVGIDLWTGDGDGSKAKVENNSTATHVFNVSFSLHTTTEFNPVAGSLTVNGTIFQNGNDITVYGGNQGVGLGKVLTLGGEVQGNARLIVRQDAQVKLGGYGNYSGFTEIDRGEFWLATGGSMTSSSTIYVGNGGQQSDTAKLWIQSAGGAITNAINVNAGADASKRVIGGLNTSGNVTYRGNIGLSSYAQVSAASGGQVTFEGDISGVGQGITKVGSGTVVLSGNNSYTGQTSIDVGTLRLGANDRINDGSSLYIGAAGTFDLNNFSDDVGNIVATSAGNVTLGSGQFRVNQSSDVDFSGVISGPGSFVKKGTAVLTLSGANSYSGQTYIDSGELRYTTAQAGGFTGAINVGSAGNNAVLSIGTGGLTLVNDITVVSGAGSRSVVAQNTSGNATYSGNVTMNAGVTATANNGGNLVLSGNVNTSGTGNQNLTVAGGNNTSASGVISGGGKVIKQGSGQLTLSNTGNTYTGNTEIDQGTLLISGDISGSSAMFLGNGLLNQDATLQLAGTGVSMGSLQINPTAGGSGNRTISTTTGAHSFSGTLALQRDLTVNANGGQITFGAVNLSSSGNNDLTLSHSSDVAINGVITAATGASDLNKSGLGLLTIAGNNSASNYKLNINQGTVYLTHANALGNTANYDGKVNFANNNGTLQVDTSITAGGTNYITGVTAFVNVDASQTFTQTGGFKDTGNLTKTGSGTLVLSGINTYSGATVVNAGTLVIGSAGRLDNTSAMTVSGTGRLIVNGTITSGAGVVVGSGRTLSGTGRVGQISGAGLVSPGNSPGILTTTQVDPTLGTDYAYEFTQLNNPTWSNAGASGNDVLRITDATTPFAANLTLANVIDIYLNRTSIADGELFRGGFFTDKNENFTLAVTGAQYRYWVSGDGNGTSTSFNSVDYYSLAAYNTANATTFSVSRSVVQIASANFTGGTVLNGWSQQFTINTQQLSAVPEPSMVILLLTGMATMYVARRRNRKR